MADSKISALTDGAAAAATDRIPVARSPFGAGDNRYLTPVQIKDYLLGLANTWTAEQTISGAGLTLSGNISAPAWTTAGIKLKGSPGTLTDTTSSGTVAAAYTNVLGGNTIAASAATVFTDYYSLFLTEPTAGTNVTFTNRWALGLVGGLKASGRFWTSGNGTVALPALQIGATCGFYLDSTNSLTFALNGNVIAATVTTTALRVRSGSAIGWSSTTDSTGGIDTQFIRDAANTVALQRTTNAQILRGYRTFTDSSNYQRWALQTGASYVELAGETAGTGADDIDVRLTPAGAGVASSAASLLAHSGTAIPAGGTAGAGVRMSSVSNFGVFFGSGAPSLAAAQGSLYLRSDGSGIANRLYVNTDGGTTWTNFVTAA